MTNENNYLKSSKTKNHKRTIIIILCVIILVSAIGGTIIYMMSKNSNELVGTWIENGEGNYKKDSMIFNEDGTCITEGGVGTYEIIDDKTLMLYDEDGDYGDLYFKVVGNRLYIKDASLYYGDSASNSYEDFEKHIEGDKHYYIRYEE